MGVIDRLDADGWAVIDGMLTDGECDDLLDASEQRRWPAIPPALVRWFMDARWSVPALHRLGPDVRFLREQLVTKPPQAEVVVPWHQDSGYALITGEFLTFFVALDDITLDNGCLWMLSGSGASGLVEHTSAGSFRQVAAPVAADGEPVELARGSAVVFSSFTMHRSGGNRTVGTRPAWMVQFCRADAIEAGTPHARGCPIVAEAGAWFDQPRF